MSLYLVAELTDPGGFVEESGLGIYWGEVNEGEPTNSLVESLFKNGLVSLKCNFSSKVCETLLKSNLLVWDNWFSSVKDPFLQLAEVKRIGEGESFKVVCKSFDTMAINSLFILFMSRLKIFGTMTLPKSLRTWSIIKVSDNLAKNEQDLEKKWANSKEFLTEFNLGRKHFIISEL